MYKEKPMSEDEHKKIAVEASQSEPVAARGIKGGGWSEDTLEEARQTILAVMRGAGGRNAQARIRAAETVLGKDFLAHLPDEVLLAEVRRRQQR